MTRRVLVIALLLPTCGDDRQPSYRGTARPAQTGCAIGAFECADGSCLAAGAYCDGVEQCTDGSDEHACPDDGCDEDQWQCGSGQCISGERRCDGVAQCQDETDEAAGCQPDCVGDSWQCDDGSCIDSGDECNVAVDCPDGSDENSHCDLAPDLYEPDSSPAEAGTIVPGESQQHALSTLADKDFVSLQVADWTRVTIDVTPAVPGQIVYSRLYDDKQSELDRGDSEFNDIDVVVASGTYTVMVLAYSWIDSYTLTFVATASAAPAGQ